mgnify:CR=1 FL=1
MNQLFAEFNKKHRVKLRSSKHQKPKINEYVELRFNKALAKIKALHQTNDSVHAHHT